MKRDSRPILVNLLALPATTPAVLYSFHDVLGSVGHAWPLITGEPEDCAGFEVRIVSPDGVPFACEGGVPVHPHAGFADAPAAGIVVVTDLMIGFHDDPRRIAPDAVDWLRAQYAAGAMICTVCTGAVLLAATGLLDGCEATSHWATAPLFDTYFPAVAFRRERILVVAGEGDRLVTSGGPSSWQESALYVVERFCGRDAAIRTAKIFLLGDRSDGQLPFAVMKRPRQHEDRIIADCQAWIADHYAAANPVSRMVERSGLAERTFKRRFHRATGYAPIAYVQTLRTEEAKQMLETTSLPTDEVGRAVGYEDPASFRRVFKRHAGVTPSRYRQRVRRIGRTDSVAAD